jgi:hypothetical protein
VGTPAFDRGSAKPDDAASNASRGGPLKNSAFRALSVSLRSNPVWRWYNDRREARQAREWLTWGRSGPPPQPIKAATLREYGRNFGLRRFIETGTYLGETIARLRFDFDSLASIELDPYLHRAARRRFRHDSKVKLYLGDSGHVLSELLGALTEPCLFWLDAHYSGGLTAGATANPVIAEVSQILCHRVTSHVILVDDARLFTGQDGYPTLNDLLSNIGGLRPDVRTETREDMIRITPQQST